MPHDNTVNDTRLADTNKLIRKLGTESANSALAKPKMALAIVQARIDGVLTDDDGESTYNTYLEGRRAVLAKSAIGTGAEDGGSLKANISKNTQLLKAAGLVAAGIDFAEVLETATAERDTLAKAGEKVKPAFDAYVDCARAQLKSPEAQLTTDAIIAAVKRAEAAEKDDIAKLCDTYKRLWKQADEMKIPVLSDAAANVAQAISDLGGEVPPMTKEEKEAASAMAFIRKMGFKIEVADHDEVDVEEVEEVPAVAAE